MAPVHGDMDSVPVHRIANLLLGSEEHAMKVWDYDEFADKYGFQPLDEPDITYHAVNRSQTLRDLVDWACNNDRFISVHDWGNDVLEVSLGWGKVDVLHRCFIPDGVTLTEGEQ